MMALSQGHLLEVNVDYMVQNKEREDNHLRYLLNEWGIGRQLQISGVWDEDFEVSSHDPY